MYHYIKGRIAEVLPGMAVLESGGIGYELRIPDNSAAFLAKPGDEMRFFTAMIVREDDISLYGFTERESLTVFRKLMTVSGVGAKAALSVLSSMPLSELNRAIAFEDVAILTRANGIGKKTAQRIILELKDKIGIPESMAALGDTEVAAGSAKEEAIGALIALGYTKSEAMTALIGITEPGLTAEEYIRKALTGR